MKIVQINKENWADGLKKLSEIYRLFGPVKEDDFHNFLRPSAQFSLFI